MFYSSLNIHHQIVYSSHFLIFSRPKQIRWWCISLGSPYKCPVAFGLPATVSLTLDQRSGNVLTLLVTRR